MGDEKEKQKILSNVDVEKRVFTEKIIEQNNNISKLVAQNYTVESETSEAIMNEIVTIDQILSQIKLYPALPAAKSSSTEDAIIQRLTVKIADMQGTKMKNDAYIKLCHEEVKKMDKKTSTDEDYLRKWMGEKKVWLDEVKESKLQDLTWNNGFSDDPYRTYEFKLMKLIFEGVLLDKIQDQIDNDIKQNNPEWLNVISEEMRMENELRDKLNGKLLHARNEMERRNIIFEEEEVKEKIMSGNLNEKEKILSEWESYFDAIWDFEPITKENYDTPFIHNFAGHQEIVFNSYLQKTKFWIWENLKRNCFNAWQFKNIFLSTEDFVLTEKVKENFLNLAIKLRTKKDEERRLDTEKEAIERGMPIPKNDYRPLNPHELTSDVKDEIVFAYLMEMIKNMESRADIRTIHPNEREHIVGRMVDEKLSFEEALSKTNEIRRTEKKPLVKRITLKDFDVYSPLMKSFINFIFVSMGNKRIKTFKENKKEVNQLITNN